MPYCRTFGMRELGWCRAFIPVSSSTPCRGESQYSTLKRSQRLQIHYHAVYTLVRFVNFWRIRIAYRWTLSRLTERVLCN